MLRPQIDQILLIEERWSGPHKTHVPDQDAPELRQFVETAFAQKRADRRQIHPGIGQQMRSYCRRTDTHATELGHLENAVIAADPIRPVESRPARGKAYCYRHDHDGQQQHAPRAQYQKQIKQTLHANILLQSFSSPRQLKWGASTPASPSSLKCRLAKSHRVVARHGLDPA
ncbi:hypothetical protein D3C87_1100730 [compost metagenome]